MSAAITNKLIESTAYMATGAILAAVSTACLVMLLVSLPLSSIEQGLAVATGIGLQASMYLLARISFSTRLIAGVLLVVSIAASTAFIETAWQRHVISLQNSNIATQSQSEAVIALQRERDSISKQISIRLTAAERDSAGRYSTRGLKRLDDVNQYHDRLNAINAQLMQLKTTPVETGADRGSMQALMFDTDRSIRLSVFALLASLIDIAAVMLFARVDLSVYRIYRQPEDTAQTLMSRTAAVTLSRTDAVISRTDAVLDQTDSVIDQTDSVQTVTESISYQEHLKDRILSGHYGLPISQRKAIDDVKTVFDDLQKQGVIEKGSKGFKLV